MTVALVEDGPMRDVPSNQQLLYDAAVRWNTPPLWVGAEEVIEAAVTCLVAGMDSPSLRLLAGASPKNSTEELRALIHETLEDLALPEPGMSPRATAIGADGTLLTRLPRDTVRFEVRAAGPEVRGHEVLIYVNDVEVTHLGAGMGMDPFDLLIPQNQLLATEIPHQVGIARCECGIYGCDATDVVIVRDASAVHWDWVLKAPLRGGASFSPDEYDIEVARIGADRSWESAEDTTARLIVTGLDRKHLSALGLRLAWVAEDHADHNYFKAALSLRDSGRDYHVFLRTSRAELTPEEAASRMLSILAENPTSWSATWHAATRGVADPPSIAGKNWRRADIGWPPKRTRRWRRRR